MPSLVVVHYHFRPGGVRTVIGQGLRLLKSVSFAGADDVILASGEAPPADWLEALRRDLTPARVSVRVWPAAGYLSEQKQSLDEIRCDLAQGLTELTASTSVAWIWAHNLSVGRNFLLGEALGRHCADRNLRLVCHHHDWWTDGRWERWREAAARGLRSIEDLAAWTVPEGPQVRHLCVHPRDARELKSIGGQRIAWVPNPLGRPASSADLSSAKQWLQARRKLPGGLAWILPSRLLRRKNLLEAALLAKILSHDGELLVTGQVSSAAEQSAKWAVQSTAEALRLPLTVGLLQGGTSIPAPLDLLGAADAVLQTSVQEGFGLGPVEAAMAHKPLILRQLPELLPAWQACGGRFPTQYLDLAIPPHLLPVGETDRRQRTLTREWSNLPPNWREVAQHSAESAQHLSPAFSRLTLPSQWEVLQCPGAVESLAEANPWLKEWAVAIRNRKLAPATWAESHAQGPAWNQRWLDQLVESARGAASSALMDPTAAVSHLFNVGLETSLRHPLLFARMEDFSWVRSPNS